MKMRYLVNIMFFSSNRQILVYNMSCTRLVSNKKNKKFRKW